MKIALLGPIATDHIAGYLDERPPQDFPLGYTGAPFMATLIGELLSRGHQVSAITVGGLRAGPGVEPMSLHGPRFSFHCCPWRPHALRSSEGRRGRMLDMFLDERRHLENVLKMQAPDVVHAHWTYEFALAALASGRPCIVTAHDDPVAIVRFTRSLYRVGRLLMALRVLRKAPRLTAVSGDLAKRLRRWARTPVTVVPNPLPGHFLAAGFVRDLPPAGQELRVVTVINGWGPWKNAQSAIVAFAQFKRQYPSASLRMFGLDFEPGGKAHRWATARGLLPAVRFEGPVSHARLVEELKGAHVLLHPSRWEACPMGIAEAMSLGLPVVGGVDSGGVGWMVDRGGLLVDVTSPEAIAAGLATLVGDARRYRECSSSALERVLQFSAASVVDQYEALYREATGIEGEARATDVGSAEVALPARRPSNEKLLSGETGTGRL